ncbi:MAG: hypothetical protein LBD64_00755 [Odoribacteraceae bacterium]|jgi:hypothetical protein|nr:hypothetical protein [Odoribacteraceae bacterium]
MNVYFVFRQEDVARDVERTTALAGKFARDENGASLFDSVVLDGDYPEPVRKLFLEARAEVLLYLTPWTRQQCPGEFDAEDFDDEKDFALFLDIPNRNMSLVMDAKIAEFITAYIIYRWLEINRPEMAAIFLARAESARDSATRAARNCRPPKTIEGWIA